ncbi:enoyl-CoA hydratase/carnithine racemase [Blastomonas natatoria]|uniref:Enoyl-CoA hydratase/carnithine racemase n=1 Tax=Blastomonas natatoria TaxID=34015 RepID=A0A2V3V3D5_9SPHN|nr:enoyl-CoA hydratase-related protein [Blastomonas natatoria]PXW76273.1 enoyl-CoA hydratase/carnithine racemase [Blastomonas natatoria]
MALSLTLHGAIAHLIIERPDKRNAFTQAMWEALPELVDRAMLNPDIRVMILRASVPGAFSAGADIAEFGAGAQNADWRIRNQAAIRRAMETLARAPKPVIAQIEGDCIGGGCGLSLACDFRIATPTARFGITPAKLGLVYSLHDTKLLVDLVGPAAAKRILFTAGLVDAAEAHRIGLIDELAEDAGAAATALAATVASVSPHSVHASKAMIARILHGQAEDDAETLAQFADAFDGPDFREGVAAFLSKRKPEF